MGHQYGVAERLHSCCICRSGTGSVILALRQIWSQLRQLSIPRYRRYVKEMAAAGLIH